MPHQCLKCGRIFEEGSSQLLKGCPDCEGNRFFYTKKPLNVEERDKMNQKVGKDANDTIMEILGEKNKDIVGKSGKWVASPNNFVAIKVQDKRKRNLAITVYGNPGKFNGIRHNLVIKPDRSSWSRFSVDRCDQLPSAIQVIRHAYQLSTNKERGI